MSENEENKKPVEVVFAPGCFDHFEGTQEELDELIQQIKEMAASGKLFEEAVPVDVEDLLEETDPSEIEEIVKQMTTPRTLQ